MDLPEIIQKINKDKKATKLTTLDRAKAMKLKRFFSGSFLVDYITGGGYAYRRLQLLFGSRSAGKNAQMNQMIAFNQRLCRKCLGIRPEFFGKANDRWATILTDVIGTPICKCDEPLGKVYVILDFEKSISIETPQTVEILKLTNKTTGDPVDELDWNDIQTELETLKLKEKLEDGEAERIKNLLRICLMR